MQKSNTTLVVSTLLRTIVFIAIIGLFIFVPAGSLAYWQGWVFLFTFAISTFFITVYFLKKDTALIERRLKTNETKGNQKIFQAISGSLFFLGLLVIPGLDHRFSWSSVSNTIVIISDVIVFFGFVIVFTVFKTNSYTSAIIEVTKGQKVITGGLYSVVRHPMYLGALLIIVFMPLALNSFIGLFPSMLLCVFVILRLLDEEKVLRAELNGYSRYCNKTRYRIIPYIW